MSKQNRNNINKNIHYYALMQPIDYSFAPFGIAFTCGSDEPVWFECAVDESRYKVDDNYKITLRALNGGAYEHYYQEDFMSLMYKGLIIPKTSEDMHIEFVSFKECIPNSCAYLQHEGHCVVGTFEPIKVGDKVRYRWFSTILEVIAINKTSNLVTVQWTDDDGNTHTQTDAVEEYMKVV